MTRTAAKFAVVLLLAASVAVGLAQISSSATGVQLAHPDEGWDIIFPLSVAQCEPVSIYYNHTLPTPGRTIHISVNDPQESTVLLTIDPPQDYGVGYLEWICDIPAGHSFIVQSLRAQYYVVGHGSSSSCLGKITTTYAHMSYNTMALRSYTENAPRTISPSLSEDARCFSLDPSTLSIHV